MQHTVDSESVCLGAGLSDTAKYVVGNLDAP